MGLRMVSKDTTGLIDVGLYVSQHFFFIAFHFANSKESKTSKSSSPIITNMSSVPACITPTQVSSTTSGMKLDPNEPPTKLIKLFNSSAILAPMDKDNKMLHSGQLTLQQVMVIRAFAALFGTFYESFSSLSRWSVAAASL